MPLTKDEMIKICKTIFYAKGHRNQLGEWNIDRKVVFEILNDYSPNAKINIRMENDQAFMDIVPNK